MMYCFVKEDFDKIAIDNPLYLQAEFSKKINSFCQLNLKEHNITDKNGNNINLNIPVVLRTTCTNVDRALMVLDNLNILVVESKKDIDIIEDWFKFYKTKREIIEISAEQISNVELPHSEKLFIKSKKKDFSLVTKKENVVNRDARFVKFIEDKCSNKILLVSNFLKICKDSLGVKETRHFVFNRKIINSSRCFYSLKHNVPKSHIRSAQDIVNQLSIIDSFPKNYVLDVGEFIENGEKYIDVVEINPLSTSMCYVNNSIFENPNYNFKFENSFGFGYEFFYDFLKNPNNYVLERVFGVNYEYINENRYEI